MVNGNGEIPILSCMVYQMHVLVAIMGRVALPGIVPQAMFFFLGAVANGSNEEEFKGEGSRYVCCCNNTQED